MQIYNYLYVKNSVYNCIIDERLEGVELHSKAYTNEQIYQLQI